MAAAAAVPDHAGSTLCRLLAGHPEVSGVEILGQEETDGTITYWLAVLLPGGRRLLVDVEDVGDLVPAVSSPAARSGRAWRR